MNLKLGRYDFTLYASAAAVEDKAGVYAVVCKSQDKYRVLDLGESATPQSRLQRHERRPCWQRNADGPLMYAVYYTPFSTQRHRLEMELELRQRYNPPCGMRPAKPS